MNHKRRKRRRGGIRGCCGMCMLQTHRTPHMRIPTKQERAARTVREYDEYDDPSLNDWVFLEYL